MNLSKKFIWASLSPAAVPVLFVKKLGGGIQYCVNYYDFNALTIKNKHLLLLIRETLD